MNLLQNEKNRFLADEFFKLSWNAALQRNKTFASIESENFDKLKKDFYKEMKKTIFQILSIYAIKNVTHEEHLKNIEKLIEVSKNYSSILANYETEEDGSSDSSVNQIKAGTAQKLLNMMLKYCWCAGWINTPPDFPIDSHNLKALLNLHNSEEFKKSWTKNIKEIKDYDAIIKRASNEIQETLALWELKTWKRNIDTEE